MLKEIRKKILADDKFVLDEARKLQVLYGLKTEIRYALERDESFDTESVAEHIYGMMMLAHYFVPLEDTERVWDVQKINTMILFHDIDEIETGDVLGYLKTTEHLSVDIEATANVVKRLPKIVGECCEPILEEYFTQQTSEAKIAKAIDKFEPMIHLWNENGKNIIHRNQTTLEQHWSIKKEVTSQFPVLMRFSEVLTNDMVNQGFFDHS